MKAFTIGSIVRFRGREWVVMPSGNDDLVNLRPLTGGDQDICGVYLPAEAEQPVPASFPLLGKGDIGDFEATRLLRNAARLILRHGAGPFRSLGHLSFRPRPFQLVPLLMALRLNPVRMLIADDVGVGKTIEAALIARELMDRGEIKRIAVICPPYLCDQWQRELYSKFSIDAKVIRSETVSRLERSLPRPDISIFEYYPHVVVSVDFVKLDSHKYNFLSHCPELVIVDEAHGCARPAGAARSQQQRHDFVYEIAKRSNKHVLLVTATPHSGVEESFLSLLGMINPQFESFNIDSTDKEQISQLAKHIIQRKRDDIENWMGTETRFPKRDAIEAPYVLSPEYRKLFHDVYEFARELISSDERQQTTQRRVHYWAALALLRCVMSSPGAAKTALLERAKQEIEDYGITDLDSVSLVMDSSDVEKTTDIVPTHTVTESVSGLSDSDKRRLREFAKQAEKLTGSADTKMKKTEDEIRKLLKEGYRPVVFCRFIATSDYVAEELKNRLGNDYKNLHIISVTGELSEEERVFKVDELCKSEQRILVATDCLSEGINLQDYFDAVLHYDLPWNPNRLDQREGRVDRFGQSKKIVKAVLIYGQDNPIDGAVLKVLLRKAREIHKRLGVMVPLPVNSESVMQTVLKALFFGGDEGLQLRLLDTDPYINETGQLWEKAEQREKKNRAVFAQHAMKPDEVAKELELTDSILGDIKTVEQLIQSACQRFNSPIIKKDGYWILDREHLPKPIRDRLPDNMSTKLVFDQPVPEGMTYISRTHPLTSTLAEYILDNSLSMDGDRNASARYSVIRSSDVDTVTTVLLLRLRFLIEDTATSTISMAEESIVTGFKGIGDIAELMDIGDSMSLLELAKPTANVSEADKSFWLAKVLTNLATYNPLLEKLAQSRAEELHQSYERVRKTIKSDRVEIRANLPVDVLAAMVILPQPNA